MSRITVKELMKNAIENKYSVGYFESWSLESAQAVVRAAENMNSPVMIGVCGTYVGEPKREYKESITLLQATYAKLAEEAKVPIAILMNESDDENLVIEAAKAGFDFVMYAPVFAEKIPTLDELTVIQKRIVEQAHPYGVAVEGEVGELPMYNTETGMVYEGEDTTPEVLKKFVEETGVDTVAVSVGNCHLKEDGYAKINFDSLKKLADTVDIPLVLHGGTSISKEDLRQASGMGVGKVNFGTAMKRIAINVMKDYLANNDVDKMDPNDVLGRGTERDLICLQQKAITQYVEETIEAMNGKNKAF